MRRIQSVPDAKTLYFAAAGEFTRAVSSSKGPFRVALSGGSTPRGLFALLADASAPYRARVPWDRVHFFWGDERCVPPDAPDSNYRMARETLLDKLGIPPERVFRMAGELDPEDAAKKYEAVLRAQLGDAPRFDFVFLGLGPDGHTASLFPGTPAVTETARLVAVGTAPVSPTARLTLTMPVLNAAARVVFVVSGAAKAAVAARVLTEPPSPAFPAGLVDPSKGSVLWLLDQDAAASLPPAPKA